MAKVVMPSPAPVTTSSHPPRIPSRSMTSLRTHLKKTRRSTGSKRPVSP